MEPDRDKLYKWVLQDIGQIWAGIKSVCLLSRPVRRRHHHHRASDSPTLLSSFCLRLLRLLVEFDDGTRERDGFLSETFFSRRLTRRAAGREGGRKGSQSVGLNSSSFLRRRRRMLKGFFGFAFPSQSKLAICQRDFAPRSVYLSWDYLQGKTVAGTETVVTFMGYRKGTETKQHLPPIKPTKEMIFAVQPAALSEIRLSKGLSAPSVRRANLISPL